MARAAPGRVGSVAGDRSALVSATPALRLSWALAVAAAAAVSIVSSRAAADDVGLFLLPAPLVLLIAIAAAFGPTVEPTHEIAVAAPFDKVRLLALRASIVLGSAFAMLAGAFARPALGRTDASWLLPALALAVTLTVKRLDAFERPRLA